MKQVTIFDKYILTSDGTVISKPTGVKIKKHKNFRNEEYVMLISGYNNYVYRHYIKELVLEYFKNTIKKDTEFIINLDKDSSNNEISNLKVVDFYTAIYYFKPELLETMKGYSSALPGNEQYCFDNNIILLKDCYGYEDRYCVTTNGEVYGKVFITKLKPMKYDDGYLYIGLNIGNSVKKKEKIHRMIGKTFIPCKDMDILHINHIDENPSNNIITNLEFVTPAINVRKYYFKNDNRDPEEVFNIRVNDKVFKTVTEAAKYIALNEPTKKSESIGSYIANIFYRNKNNNYLNKYKIKKEIL